MIPGSLVETPWFDKFLIWHCGVVAKIRSVGNEQFPVIGKIEKVWRVGPGPIRDRSGKGPVAPAA